MSCPYCKASEFIPEVAKTNVKQYNSTPLVATLCCKQPIRVVGTIIYEAAPVKTNSTTDDWGTPFISSLLVDKYILAGYDINLTTSVVYKVIEDNNNLPYITVENIDNQKIRTKFNRTSILLSGTKKEIEEASKEHQQLIAIKKSFDIIHKGRFDNWLKKYKKD